MPVYDPKYENLSPAQRVAIEKHSKVAYKLGYMEECLKVVEKLNLPEDAKILDLGCGEGELCSYFKKENVVGIDTCVSSIKTARKLYDKKFMVMSAENLSFEDNTFDYIFAINVLHHVHNPVLALDECYRVLRKGGRLITVDTSCLNPFGIMARWFSFHRIEKSNRPNYKHFNHTRTEIQFTKSQYNVLFKRSPFSKFSIKPHRFFVVFLFMSLYWPFIAKPFFYSFFLESIERFGNWFVKHRFFGNFCYFWRAEAIK
jgi:ubiquinone/menaquinone biosynthesis C-methylase UbiE